MASPGQAEATRADVAAALEELAELLAAQDAGPFRVRAWRRAAETIRQSDVDLEAAVSGAGAALEDLPGVGERIAGAVAEYVRSGGIGLLERLRGEVSPEDAIARVPGVGPALAARVHEQLGVESLEELEVAAHDGRLAAVPGFGPRRVRGVRTALDSMLGRSARRRGRARRRRSDGDRPPVSVILAVDARYREDAAAGRLRRIAPRRFNPEREAWLPILHTERDGWSFTALFSNTARAHELGKTDDWVVLFHEPDGGGEERQCTVVTETAGPLVGRRVVRGREEECRAHYGRTA